MAQVDYFLKLDGVKGEASDSKHKEEIELESFSWGETNSGSAGHGSGAGAGKVAMQDFHFVKKVDKASPVLFVRCASGEHIKEAILTARKAGKDQQDYFKVTMSDLLVSSYQVGGSAGSDIVPTEQVSLNFSKIQFFYKAQKADGTLDAEIKQGWDQKQNKTV
jgi:type VI secretion system secreted protein Hcp